MKCKCKDCGKDIDQETMQPALVVNPKDPEHCYVLCEVCRDKRGHTIVSCKSCTELTDAHWLERSQEPAGFTPCPSCGKDIYTGKPKEEYKAVRCKKCGCIIHDPEEDARAINEGTDNEYVVCELCFDSMWDLNEITKCTGCGRWFDNNALHRDPEVEDFIRCPACGVDVIEGHSREFALSMMEERKQPKVNPGRTPIPNYREQAEAMIFEMANIVSEYHMLRKENSDLRLRVATLEALVEAMRNGGDYSKYEFLSQIEVQNATYDLHRASGWSSNVDRVDDWERRLAEFMARCKKGK